MKPFIRTIFFAYFTLTFFACQEEIEPVVHPADPSIPEGCEMLTLKAVAEQTKTSLSGGNTVWSEGDKIKVICSDNSATDFTIVNGTGTTTGDFRGYVPSGKTALYAVYPSTAYVSVDDTNVSVNVPQSQAGSFGAGNIAVAKVAADHSLVFKNMNAFLVFQLKTGTNVTKVRVSSVDGTSLSGTFKVDCSGSNPAPGNIGSGSNYVDMATSGAGTYYMSIIPMASLTQSASNHTKGLKMTYYNGESETGVYYLNKNLPTEVNTMYAFGEVETARNYYVTVDGAGTKDGMSWANAMSGATMWKKLHISGSDSETDNAKKDAVDGAAFHLAAGTYIVDNKTINLSDVSVTFKGGYNASTGNRNITNNVTSLSGNSASRILTVSSSINITFDGVNFINGSSTVEAGALRISGSSAVTLKDCQFSGNYAYTRAGAIFSDSSGAFTCTNVTFSANHNGDGLADAGYGGAVAISSDSAVCTFENCIFNGNYSTKWGGAALSYQNGSDGGGRLSITGTTFNANYNNFAPREGEYSEYCGAVRLGNDGCESEFSGCTFTDNYTYSTGDAERAAGGAVCYYGSKRLGFKNCYFEGNHATRGGAIAAYGSGELFLNACSFSGNWISGGRGTAIWFEQTKAFCMNTCSFKDNTYTCTTAGDTGNWVWIRGTESGGNDSSVEKCFISNCSLIGSCYSDANLTVKKGDELIYIRGMKTDCSAYLLNNLLINTTDGANEKDQWALWHTNTKVYGFNNVFSRHGCSSTTYEASGDKTGVAKTTTYFNTVPSWHSEKHSWSWGGLKANGSSVGYTPMMTKTTFDTQINAYCSDFKTWLGSAWDKDAFGSYRGDNTWPVGAWN